MVECNHLNNKMPGQVTVVRTYGATMADAITAWNRRASPPAPSQGLEERVKDLVNAISGSYGVQTAAQLLFVDAVEKMVLSFALSERADAATAAWTLPEKMPYWFPNTLAPDSVGRYPSAEQIWSIIANHDY